MISQSITRRGSTHLSCHRGEGSSTGHANYTNTCFPSGVYIHRVVCNERRRYCCYEGNRFTCRLVCQRLHRRNGFVTTCFLFIFRFPPLQVQCCEPRSLGVSFVDFLFLSIGASDSFSLFFTLPPFLADLADRWGNDGGNDLLDAK